MTKVIGEWIGFFIAILLFSTFVPLQGQAASSTPALNVNISPSKEEFLKPLGADAQGDLNITLNPEGKLDDISNELRKPLDVVFVLDKSGSMGPLYGNKLDDAKKAMNEAVKVFQANRLANDRFGLVTFDTDVKDIISLTSDLQAINKKVQSMTADGGTNYAQSLERAGDILKDSKNDKYIIFLTDGFPTQAQEEKYFNFSGNVRKCNSWGYCKYDYVRVNSHKTVYYNVYTNGSQDAYILDDDGYRIYVNTSGTPQSIIKSLSTNQALSLANQKVKLYSIGFGTNQELDMNYLTKLSETTGSKAYQGDTSNLSDLFRSITTEIGQYAMKDVQVKVKIQGSGTSFPGKVKLADNANAYMDGDYAVINLKDVPYVLGQTPSATSYSLPLTFDTKGTYNFSDVSLSYKNLSGSSILKKHDAVKVEIKDKIAPTFKGTVGFLDTNKVGRLIKKEDRNSESNQFDLIYTLTPDATLEKADRGTLQTIKLTQILPEGITVVNPPSNVSVKGNLIEVTFTDIPYNNGSFSINKLTQTIKLQANWAMNQTFQNPTVSYNDSNAGARSVILTAPKLPIIAKVVLEDTLEKYSGDAYGNIEKITKNTNTLIQTIKLKGGEQELAQPIKSMVFTGDKTAIDVTYSNDTKKRLKLVPSFEIRGQDSNEVIKNGSVSSEKVKFSLVDLIPGEGVTYEYKVNNGSWTTFQQKDEVTVDKVGEVTIKVRATGGFAKANQEVTQTVTIRKLVDNINVDPASVTLFVGEKITLNASVSPADATNKDVKWMISDTGIVKKDILVTGSSKYGIIGVAPGNTTVVVESVDGAVKKEIPVQVLDDFKFKYPSITMEPGEERNIKDLLVYRNGGLLDTLLNRQVIESIVTEPKDNPSFSIVSKDNSMFIVAKKVGYGSVVATGAKVKQDGTRASSSMIVIVKKRQGTDGSGAKW
ncbi:VWA domain-containing protein [Priestia flexa]|uniref:VWA domain-containing protein n=2 Tax=Bacteria TaxID=2 RepID=A0ABU4J6R3_9BACI|nr:VWA domain-containing protein [Priestia flexa]MDW8516645.1 VWA domain-containing protein [Priestia flexa]QCS51799.1 VWA domain-containing protein [Priestia flexa]